jgi:hypothetical protein
VDIILRDFAGKESCELGVKVDKVFSDWPTFFFVCFQEGRLSETAEDEMQFVRQIHGIHH